MAQKSKKFTVIVLPPDAKPYTTETDFAGIQAICGELNNPATIERFEIAPGLVGWANEDGFYLGLPPNRNVYYIAREHRCPQVEFVGTIVLAGGRGANNAGFASIDQKWIDKYVRSGTAPAK